MSLEPLRVLLLTHSYTPEVSPPQRRWDSFVYVMRNEGWDISVVTPRAVSQGRKPRLGSSELGIHGEHIRSYASLRKPRSIPGKVIKHALDGFLMLPRALFQPRPNVVIATVPSLPTMFSGFIVSRVLDRPLIIEMRDAWPDLISDSRILKSKLLTQIAHRVVREIQRRATLVITVTDGFAQVLRRDGVAVVRTVHNGISTRNLEPMPERPVARAEKLHVLYLGNLGESQGLESVIAASALAKDTVELRIVGSGTAKQRLQQFANQIQANVLFEPPARGESLRSHYQWADTCIVSLRNDWQSFDHTVPSKVYELLALSKHITGLVVGEAAAIISNADAGDIVDHDPENIAKLWNELATNPQRTDIGSKGREWVFAKASLETLAGKYVELIRSVAR